MSHRNHHRKDKYRPYNGHRRGSRGPGLTPAQVATALGDPAPMTGVPIPADRPVITARSSEDHLRAAVAACDKTFRMLAVNRRDLDTFALTLAPALDMTADAALDIVERHILDTDPSVNINAEAM